METCLFLLDVWNVCLFVAEAPFFVFFANVVVCQTKAWVHMETWPVARHSVYVLLIYSLHGDHPKVKYFPMQPKRMMTRFSRIDNERYRSFGRWDLIVIFIQVNVAVFNKHDARVIRCCDLNVLDRVSKKQIFFLSIFQKKKYSKKKKHTLCGREMFGIDT